MELVASAGDPSYKENIFIPKSGTSTAAVSQCQVLDDVLSGASRICGGEMPQEMRDEIVSASHRRQSVLKTLVGCSNRSDGIRSSSGGDGGSGDGRGDDRDGQEKHTKRQTTEEASCRNG